MQFEIIWNSREKWAIGEIHTRHRGWEGRRRDGPGHHMLMHKYVPWIYSFLGAIIIVILDGFIGRWCAISHCIHTFWLICAKSASFDPFICGICCVAAIVDFAHFSTCLRRNNRDWRWKDRIRMCIRLQDMISEEIAYTDEFLSSFCFCIGTETMSGIEEVVERFLWYVSWAFASRMIYFDMLIWLVEGDFVRTSTVFVCRFYCTRFRDKYAIF